MRDRLTTCAPRHDAGAAAFAATQAFQKSGNRRIRLEAKTLRGGTGIFTTKTL
jgi:hypothetical protein